MRCPFRRTERGAQTPTIFESAPPPGTSVTTNMHTDKDAPLHPFLKSKLGHVINGRVVDSASGKVFETLNPATGKVLARLPEGDATDVDLAVKAARSAFEGPWSKWTPYQRQALIVRIHDLVDK